MITLVSKILFTRKIPNKKKIYFGNEIRGFGEINAIFGARCIFPVLTREVVDSRVVLLKTKLLVTGI